MEDQDDRRRVTPLIFSSMSGLIVSDVSNCAENNYK